MKQNIEKAAKSNPRLAQIPTINPRFLTNMEICSSNMYNIQYHTLKYDLNIILNK